MERVPTGIEGLDELLGGGFPKGRIILVSGGPGTGKTVFAMQYLYRGVVEHGDKGVFVTLDEPIERLDENMASFGIDLPKLREEGKLSIVALNPIQFVTIRPGGLIHIIREAVKPGVKRLAIDPLTTMLLQEKDPYQQRLDIMRLFSTLSELGCTVVVTSEARHATLTRTFHVEEFLADGVIILHKVILKSKVIQALQIEKMRGITYDGQLRPYQITTEKGMVVYPKERIIELE